MRESIKEWGNVIALVILLAFITLASTAGADGIGSGFAEPDEQTIMVWNAMTGVSNTNGQCNPNGVSDRHIVSLVNGGAGAFDMWLQDGPESTGPWSNSTTSTMLFNTPTDSNSFLHRGTFSAGPCFRFHTEDVNLTAANTVTPTLRTWR